MTVYEWAMWFFGSLAAAAFVGALIVFGWDNRRRSRGDADTDWWV